MIIVIIVTMLYLMIKDNSGNSNKRPPGIEAKPSERER